MKEFIKIYYKEIIQVVLGLLLVFLLVRTFTPIPDNSELIKYKLEKLDEEINTIKEQRKKIDESIQLYNENIQKIDFSLSKLRVEKNVVNNFYEIKENKLSKSTTKEVDSLLRNRYKY
jgi:septal ring factor EnvC (AmiA/AmiB activator)